MTRPTAGRGAVVMSMHEQSTDSTIVLAIEAQQVKASDILYDRYSKLVYSTAIQSLNNVEEAEEGSLDPLRSRSGC